MNEKDLLASPEPFALLEPVGKETPVVVEVPHAGVYVDPESAAVSIAPLRSIGKDADLYVEELFSHAPQHGAHLLYSKMSRYVCDLNRDEADLDGYTTPSGTSDSSPHGVVWRKTTEGRAAIAGPLGEEEIERRLRRVYRPYHLTLSRLLREKKRRFGFVILVCGHSMPTHGRMGERRADVVPGSRGGTTVDPKVLRLIDRLSAEWQYSVAHDTPYRGGFSTTHYGSPSNHTHAVQIELARHLYMDETTLAITRESFEKCRSYCDRLVAELGRVSL